MNDVIAASNGEPDRSPAPRGGRSGLRWTLTLACAALLAGAWLSWQWLDSGLPLPVPVSVVIDGEPWAFDGAGAALSWPDKIALAGGLAIALVAVPLALGIALMAVVAAVLVALVLGVGLPLLLCVALLGVLLSPLWLLGWLLWRAASPRRSATIAA
jgi:hypothetical protein